MKVAFVQSILYEYTGTMSLAGWLKANNHEAKVFVEPVEPDIVNTIKSWDPGLLAFSLTSPDAVWAEQVIKKLRRHFDLPIICGGPHPTYFPEMIQDKNIDFICRGEGEEALLDIVNALEKNGATEHIQNIWLKKNGSIIKNPVRPLIKNLDDLPQPDREIYRHYDVIFKNPTRSVIAARGCPYSCTYCHNHLLKKMYGNDVMRLPGYEHLFTELDYLKNNGTTKTISFADDTFSMNKKWLLGFLEQYNSRIGLPFLCTVHAHSASDEIISCLAKAGCFQVCMGVESGSERVRRDILGRNVDDRKLIDVAETIHNNGLKLLTFNMVGLPTETVDEAWKTVELNITMKTDYPWCSIFQPYPRTQLSERCKELGLIPDNEGEQQYKTTYFEGSLLAQDNISDLVRIQKIFWYYVKFPNLKLFWKFILYILPDSALNFLFLFSAALRHFTRLRQPLWYTIKLSWFSFKIYRLSKKVRNEH